MAESAATAKREPEASAPGAKAIVELMGVGKTFFRGKEPIRVLEGIDLDDRRGRLRGPHGALGVREEHAAQSHRGPRPPSTGSHEVAGDDFARMSEASSHGFARGPWASSSRRTT